jgi:hypothetical protein
MEIIGAIAGLILIVVIAGMLRKLTPAPVPPKRSKGRVVECGDLNGVNMVSTPNRTTVTRGGKLVHRSDAQGVYLHSDESGVKKIRDIR